MLIDTATPTPTAVSTAEPSASEEASTSLLAPTVNAPDAVTSPSSCTSANASLRSALIASAAATPTEPSLVSASSTSASSAVPASGSAAAVSASAVVSASSPAVLAPSALAIAVEILLPEVEAVMSAVVPALISRSTDAVASLFAAAIDTAAPMPTSSPGDSPSAKAVVSAVWVADTSSAPLSVIAAPLATEAVVSVEGKADATATETAMPPSAPASAVVLFVCESLAETVRLVAPESEEDDSNSLRAMLSVVSTATLAPTPRSPATTPESAGVALVVEVVLRLVSTCPAPLSAAAAPLAR